MSWILGFVGKSSKDIIDGLYDLSKEALQIINEKNLFIAVGGNKHTCFSSGHQKGSAFHWVVTGVGISCVDEKFHLLNQNTWDQNLSFDITNDFKVSGHYIQVKWNEDELVIENDKLGIRDIYYFSVENGVFFSTRTDWLMRFRSTTINFHEFGSRWILFNQISPKSIFADFKRLVSGSIVICRNSFKIKSVEKNEWIPSYGNDDFAKDSFRETLNDLLESLLEEKFLSLSISGGLDSRLLLSYLISYNRGNWDTHTFGAKEHPDSIVANGISKDFNFDHEQINIEIPSVDKCLGLLREYVAQTLVNNSASGVIQLTNYYHLQNENRLIIDGGFGEIWRREFLNRLLYKGRKHLLNYNPGEIIPYLQIERVDIFNKDINEIMFRGCVVQLDEIYQRLPNPNDMGVENWLDLFAIKTRLVNYYGHEQARLDGILLSLMLFVQLPLLEHLFDMKIGLRKNGRLFKRIIRKNIPRLAKYPLAKNTHTYPFFFSTLQNRLYTILKKKIGRVYSSNNTVEFLIPFKEYVFDTFSSQEIGQTGIYDLEKIYNLLAVFKDNPSAVADKVDWMLSFEIFRQQMDGLYDN